MVLIHGNNVWITGPLWGESTSGFPSQRVSNLDPLSRSPRHRPACSMGATIYPMMTWKCSPHYWSFVRGIHRWLVDSPHKGSVCLHPGHSETDMHSEWVRSIVHLMMNVKTWKCRWMHYWPFERGIHWSSVDSSHKGQVINWDSPHKGSVMRSFDVFFDVSQNKLLNKQLSCWWSEMPWCSCDITVMRIFIMVTTGMSLGCHWVVTVNGCKRYCQVLTTLMHPVMTKLSLKGYFTFKVMTPKCISHKLMVNSQRNITYCLRIISEISSM